jgi:glycosyltransferase involved in cell wall biosynthesis
MKKKKIFHLLTNLSSPGGVETAAMSSLELLNETFDFYIISVGQVNESFLSSVDPIFRKKIINIPTPHLFMLPISITKTVLFILKEKPDILITSLWRNNIIGILSKILLRKKLLYIFFMHNNRFTHFLEKISSPLAIRMSDICFADSNAAKKLLQSLVPQKTINVVSMLRFEVANLATTSTPSITKSEFSQKTIKCISLARIDTQKRLDRAVKIFHLLKNKYNYDITLDLYGADGGLLEDVLSLVNKYDLQEQIQYKGILSHNEVIDKMRGYNFLIQCSAYEGMAMSVVEAMQMGLICLITPVGEMASYGKDEQNCLMLSLNGDEDHNIELLCEKIHKNSVEENFNNISNNAQTTFNNHLTYSESILNHLLNINA